MSQSRHYKWALPKGSGLRSSEQEIHSRSAGLEPTLFPLCHPGVEQECFTVMVPWELQGPGLYHNRTVVFFQALWNWVLMILSGILFIQNHLSWTMHLNEFLHGLFWWTWEHGEFAALLSFYSFFLLGIIDPMPWAMVSEDYQDKELCFHFLLKFSCICSNIIMAWSYFF